MTSVERIVRPASLPGDHGQQLVCVRFREPIRRIFKDEFMRIRLTRDGLASGEEDFYRAEVVQPQRLVRGVCKVCWQPLQPRLDGRQECRNAACREFRRGVIGGGPVRGVACVRTRLVVNDRVAIDANGRPVDFNVAPGLLSGVILCLDRRYETRVLADVYRAAREVAEQCGWAVVS